MNPFPLVENPEQVHDVWLRNAFHVIFKKGVELKMHIRTILSGTALTLLVSFLLYQQKPVRRGTAYARVQGVAHDERAYTEQQSYPYGGGGTSGI